MSKTETRRERRIAARRAQIIEAAAIVFAEKGFQRSTTREIAQTADLSEGTLYNYFESKQALLLGVAEQFVDHVASSISDLEAEGIEEMLAQFLTRRFRSGRQRRLFLLFMSEARNNDHVRDYIKEASFRIINETEQRIRTLVDAGIMRPVDPGIAARTFGATIMGFAFLFDLGREMWEGIDMGGERFPAERLGFAVTDIFLQGLLTDDHERREKKA